MDRKFWIVLALLLFAGYVYYIYLYSPSLNERGYIVGDEFNRYARFDVTCEQSGTGYLSVYFPSDMNTSEPFVFSDENGRVLPFAYGYAADLPYWIETDENGTPVRVWIRVPVLPAHKSVTILVKKEPGHRPDGSAVFDFFDDFSGPGLDTNKWQVLMGSVFVGNGVINATSDFTVLATKRTFNLPYTVTVVFSGAPSSGDPTYWFGVDQYDSQVEASKWYRLAYWRYNGSVETYSSFSDSAYTFGTVSHTSSDVFSVTYRSDGIHVCANGTCWDYHSYDQLSGRRLRIVWYNSYRQPVTLVYVRKYAPQSPIVHVYNLGGYYAVSVGNTGDTDLNDFQVAVPADQLGVRSASESIHFFANPYPVVSCKEKERMHVFLFYNGRRELNVSVAPASVLMATVYMNSPSNVSLYPGSSAVSVSPDTTSPGERNVTVRAYTESPWGVHHLYCELNYYDPVSRAFHHLESEANADSLTFAVNLSEEGVYRFNYRCYTFLTQELNGSATAVVVIPDPSVKSLDVSVSGIPPYLTSPGSVTAVVSLTSGGSPVSGATCYLDYNGVVDQNVTGASGTASFTFVAYPDTGGKISCYKSGYHPVEYRFEISSSPSSGGASSGGTSGGAGPSVGAGGAPSPSPSPSPSRSGSSVVQPASPVRAQVRPGMVLGTLFILTIIYFLLRLFLHI